MALSRRGFLNLSGASALALAWPAQADEIVTLGGLAFGTYWRISFAPSMDTTNVRQKMETIIHSVDAGMSPYLAQSELSRFNRSPSKDWVPVSAQIHKVVEAALRLSDFSAGSFDPTVGPIVGRFGFGPIEGARVGSYQQLALRSGALRKTDAALTLDLCGIAKGFALDRMVEDLDAAGLEDFLVELGGEVFARGRHPSGRAWHVAIEQPVSTIRGLAHLVALEGRAIATSGNNINFYDVGDRHYSHIIDPHISAPITGAIMSVSVLADGGMAADGLATALMVMGLEEGASFAQSRAIDALFLAKDGAGVKTIPTGRFAEVLLA